MDGELDYEEEVDEDKEKKVFDLEKKDAEPEKKVESFFGFKSNTHVFNFLFEKEGFHMLHIILN